MDDIDLACLLRIQTTQVALSAAAALSAPPDAAAPLDRLRRANAAALLAPLLCIAAGLALIAAGLIPFGAILAIALPAPAAIVAFEITQRRGA